MALENCYTVRRFHVKIKLYEDDAVTSVIHRLKEGEIRNKVGYKLVFRGHLY